MSNNKKSKSIAESKINKSQELFLPLDRQEQQAISGGYYGRRGSSGGGCGGW